MNTLPFQVAAILALLAAPADGPAEAKDTFAYNNMLGRGINLGNALDAPHEGEWGLTLKESYFEAIRAAGFQSVRIPVRWSTHMKSDPPYTIDPDYLKRVDWAVEQTLSRGMVAVLNSHHDDFVYKAPDANLGRVEAGWRQVATRFRERPDRLFFELLNEPNDKLTDERWQAAIPGLLAAVRETNPDRIVIVGPGSWNSIDHLAGLTLPEGDRKIIATFHYYNPFQFTHQDADFVPGSKAWKGRTWTGTPEQLAALRRDLDKAAAWGKANNRPLYNGEFGAYSGADMDSRATWTAAVARECEARGFSWAYWEFGSGFGAFDVASDQWRGPLLKALIPGGAAPSSSR